MTSTSGILKILAILIIFTFLFPASISYFDQYTIGQIRGVQSADGNPGPAAEPAYARSQPQTRASWNGEYKVVVICAEFPDKNATTPASTISNLVNTNMNDYYDEVSYEQFSVVATVANDSWLMMPNNITYYTRNNKIGEFVRDALDASDPYIDYNQFRTSGSSALLVIVVHSGQDEASSGNPDDIWSHMSGIAPKQLDNSWVTQYCTVSEFSPMGTFAHEFGHLLGLPDLHRPLKVITSLPEQE